MSVEIIAPTLRPRSRPAPEETVNCPNCDAGMEHRELEHVYGSGIQIDLCFACHVLWFDKRESIQLSPSGTLELFRVIHQHRDDPRHALGARAACPRCGRRLSLRHDIGKGGRFSYYACLSGHGRLTPFSEFLKEKEFVRELSPAEQSRLKAAVKQVQCSGCGAPVELTSGFQCGHCGAPITVLDTDAVEKTLRRLSDEQERRSGDPEAKELQARALASMEAMRTRPDDQVGQIALRRRGGGGLLGADLLSASIGFIFGDF